MQGKNEAVSTFFNLVELLKMQVTGIIDNFLSGLIFKAIRDPYWVQLTAFEASYTNADNTSI